jgi:hypothetical protein
MRSPRGVPLPGEPPDEFVRRHNFPLLMKVDAYAPTKLAILHRPTADTPKHWPFRVYCVPTWRI